MKLGKQVTSMRPICTGERLTSAERCLGQIEYALKDTFARPPLAVHRPTYQLTQPARGGEVGIGVWGVCDAIYSSADIARFSCTQRGQRSSPSLEGQLHPWMYRDGNRRFDPCGRFSFQLQSKLFPESRCL